MKVVFLSNYFNHHQKPFCEAMYALLGEDFAFIATAVMSVERIKLGYVQNDTPPYIFKAYECPESRESALKLINGADAVITGSAPSEYLAERLRKGKLVLRYSERPYKKRPSFLKRLYHAVHLRMRDYGNRNVYMLCSSAYTAVDFRSIGMYKKRMFRWGYFPDVKAYNVNALIQNKKKNTILWCGRFIDWKHPDDAIRLAVSLKEEGYHFRLNMIGTGPMEKQLKKMVEFYNLKDVVCLLGSMSPEQVRTYMEEAGIFIFTSDRQEGWGAVLNEAMASGCAVVANRAIGSVPYLLNNGENGLVYDTFEQLYENVALLLEHPIQVNEFGKLSYNVMVKLWNAKVAAERLLILLDRMNTGRDVKVLFENGPCSYDDGILSGE